MAKHLYTFDNPPNRKHIDEAVRILEKGGLLIYPTDVNWAVGCDATNSSAVDLVYRLKPSHPREKPLSLLMHSISQIAEYAEVNGASYRILRKLLPGSYTFILARAKNLPKRLGDKRKAVGVRIPNSPLLVAILEAFKKPMASGSLPIPSGKSELCTQGYELYESFGHAVDLLLDLGEAVFPRETTIIDLTSDLPLIIREGEGDIQWLEEIGAERADEKK